MLIDVVETPIQRRNAKQPRTPRPPRNETRNQRQKEKPFIAWDGEGYTLKDGTHCYSLFGNSLGETVEGKPLGWRDCIELLMDSPKDAHHVIYSGVYDTVMMFHTVANIGQLLKGFPVDLDYYRITFLRGKMLRITDRRKRETRTLYDVFTFFGSSFVKACREYLGDSPELVEIERMKALRSTFTGIDDTVRTYMGRELELLVELCDTLRLRLAQNNIHPKQWHGPGAVASAVLKDHRIKYHKGNYGQEFRRHAEHAYYGGRFEQFQRGTYIGTVYQYDIRSAYPAAMQNLPDLSTVSWEHHKGKPKDVTNPYLLCRVDTRNNNHLNGIGILPHRNFLGSIYYPEFASGWYWSIELQTKPDMFANVKEYYTPEGIEPTVPFRFVPEMYRQRAALKRANQPQQLALKLALNSLYGKLAQSKGAYILEDGSWKYPSFHEVVWAGWITAYCRSRIATALTSIDPSLVIACETDSVFCLEPIPSLVLGEGLGEWELQTLDGIKYIQSGVSLTLHGTEWEFKSRGFTVKRQQNEVELWTNFLAVKPHEMRIKQIRFGTDPRQKMFSRWYETEHCLVLDKNPLEKRVHPGCVHCDNGLSYADCLHRMFVPPIPYAESMAYKFIWTMPLDDPLDNLFAELNSDDPILSMEYIT